MSKAQIVRTLSYLAILALSACQAMGLEYGRGPMLRAGTSGIYLYRLHDLHSKTNPEIYIDDKPIGIIRSGGYLPIELKPGRHEMSISFWVNQFLLKRIKHYFLIDKNGITYIKFDWHKMEAEPYQKQHQTFDRWTPEYEPRFITIRPEIALQELSNLNYSQAGFFASRYHREHMKLNK